jgi:hypothetical protein
MLDGTVTCTLFIIFVVMRVLVVKGYRSMIIKWKERSKCEHPFLTLRIGEGEEVEMASAGMARIHRRQAAVYSYVRMNIRVEV